MFTPRGDVLEPLIETLSAGTVLHRVHRTSHPAAAFHPGRAPARPTARFSFFGDPPVPTLYAAETVDAALSETVLREVPVQGGTILLDQVEGLALSLITTRWNHLDGLSRQLDPLDVAIIDPS